MIRRLVFLVCLSLLAIASFPGPAIAAASDCSLSLSVPRYNTYGDTVSIEISGLTGFGGVDVYTRHKVTASESHILLVPGTTTFTFTYQWSPPEFPPLPPLDPGHYVVHAVDGVCVARTTFHVDRPS